MTRKLILSVAFVALSACTTHYVEGYQPESRSPISLNKTKKIALLGAYSFTTKVTDSRRSGNTITTTYEAGLKYDSAGKKLFTIGTPVEEIPTQGIDGSIPQERIQAFIKNYLEMVKKSGIEEMEKVIEAKDKKLFWKKRDVDYYVVAVFFPPFKESASNTGLLTILPFVFSAGFFPQTEDFKKSSTFFVYDRSLNLVKKISYDGQYRARTAWWARPIDGPFGSAPVPVRVYEQDVEKFEAEFAALGL